MNVSHPKDPAIPTSSLRRSLISLLAMRMHMRRFTRLTNGHSKKIENHACAVSLHTMFYNFTRKQAALKMTSAMAAGVTDRVWEMTDLVEMIEAFEAREALAA